MSAKWLQISMGWLFVMLSIAGVFYIFRALVRDYGLLRLPVTDGKMTSCEPLLTHSEPMSAKPGGKDFTPMWTVKVQFSYKVSGTEYVGTNLSNYAPRKLVHQSHQGDDPPDPIARVCRLYAAGTSVQVHYDPRLPQRSYVYFTSPLRNWPWVLLPAICGFVGWFFLFGISR